MTDLLAWLDERILPRHTPGKDGYDRGWDHALRAVRAHVTGKDCDCPEHRLPRPDGHPT